jgi:hypothetical protein
MFTDFMRVLLGFVVILGLLMVAMWAVQSKTPAYYAGRPPPPGAKGRCYCEFHGPHGGCIKWKCRHPKEETQ